MAALLRNVWLAGADPVPIRDQASVSLVRDRIWKLGGEVGLGRDEIERTALVATELATNHLDHARLGEIAVRKIERASLPGLEIIAADRGPGLRDPESALRGDPAGPRGGGLPAVFRQSHELDVDARLEEGTCVRARLYREPPPRQSDVGIYAVPIPGEPVNGDGALAVHTEDSLVLAVADGIGHGDEAAAASRAGVAEASRRAAERPPEILKACHRALLGTRGAAMNAARLGLATGRLAYACVGDVGGRIARLRSEKGLPCTPGVLGEHRAEPRLHPDQAALGEGDILVMFTDGLKSRWTLVEDPLIQRQHPIIIAQHLVATYSRGTDDVLVLVTRWR